MRLFISMLLILSMRLSAENKYDDINIVFINGIQNPVKQAESSAKALSAAIGLPESRTKAIYNETRGFLADIAETYAYGNFDGTNGGKDFTKFWQLVNGWKKYEGRTYVRPPSQALKNWYLREIRDGFLKYQGDYQDVYTEVKKLRDASPNKKLLILSHSEGTVVANLVMKELLSDYPDSQSYSAKECTRLVSIATPVSTSVGIRNGGAYTTSDEDMVIGAIRADMSSLPSNFNGVYDSTNDFKGHGLKEIYLNRGTGRRLIGSGYRLWRPNGALRNRIISQVGTMADEINENCVAYSTKVESRYGWGFLSLDETGDFSYVSFSIYQKKDGKTYQTLNLGRLLKFTYDTGSEDHGDAGALNNAEHYHITCSSSVSGLCSYLRSSVTSDYSRGSGGNRWTISVYGLQNFLSRMRSALWRRYKHN